MSATITVGTGAGESTANSYCSLVEAENFFATILDHAQWDAASTDTKNRLLITATRLIDGNFDFKGFKGFVTQALQWPRILARDANEYGGAYFLRAGISLGQYFDSTTIPPELKNAVCEYARFLLAANLDSDDRMSDPAGTGISSLEIYQGIKIAFDKGSARPVLPSSVSTMLMGFGSVRGGSMGSMRVARV